MGPGPPGWYVGKMGGVRDGSGEAEEPGKAGVASSASLNGMRPSEKAKVLEKASPDTQRLRSPRTSEHTFIHIHAQAHTHHAQHHAASAGVSTAV